MRIFTLKTLFGRSQLSLSILLGDGSPLQDLPRDILRNSLLPLIQQL
jgi:hypothetical protein